MTLKNDLRYETSPESGATRGIRTLHRILKRARAISQAETMRRTYANALLNRLGLQPFGTRLVGLLNPEPFANDLHEILAWLDRVMPLAQLDAENTASLLDALESRLVDQLSELSDS